MDRKAELTELIEQHAAEHGMNVVVDANLVWLCDRVSTVFMRHNPLGIREILEEYGIINEFDLEAVHILLRPEMWRSLDTLAKGIKQTFDYYFCEDYPTNYCRGIVKDCFFVRDHPKEDAPEKRYEKSTHVIIEIP